MYAIVNLEGRIVTDLEFRTGKEDREFCMLRQTVNQRQGLQENSSFYNYTARESISNRIRKAGLAKGRPVHIIGSLALREYTDRNGVTRMSADVGILNWHFVGAKPREPGEDTPPANMTAASPEDTGRIAEEVSIPDDSDELPL